MTNDAQKLRETDWSNCSAASIGLHDMPNATNQKRPAFLMLGAPGSAKGTHGKELGALPRFYHFPCRDVFRSLDTRTDLGQRFLEYSSKGELVPDELTVELWKDKIDQLVAAGLYKPDIDILVLDGIPRNVHQAEMLSKYVDVVQVFHLSCPDREELVRRMRKRALKDNRIDDAKEEVIRKRFDTYEEETKPILDFYPDEVICELDAAQTPVKVFYDLIGRILELDVYKELSKIVA
jgi:adenylate kinase